MVKESELPHKPDIEIIDNGFGDWWLVYDQAEGFDPYTVAVKAHDAECAEMVWCEQPRNAGGDTEQLVVVRLEREA